MTRIQVGNKSEFEIGEIVQKTADGKIIIIMNVNGNLFASEAYCTHVKKPLAKYGFLEGSILECDVHHARFVCNTGKVDSWPDQPPGKDLVTYQVTIENDLVYVNI